MESFEEEAAAAGFTPAQIKVLAEWFTYGGDTEDLEARVEALESDDADDNDDSDEL